MNSIFTSLLCSIYVAWAKTGRAPGYLYQAIENLGQRTKMPLIRDRKLFNGMLIECDLRDHVQQQIYFFGGYEPIEAGLFLSLLKPGDCVFDIGANVGFYTMLMSKKVSNLGQVHSFEPVPKNFSKLSNNYSKNGKPQNIALNQSALWDESTTLRFSLDEQHENNCGGFSAGKPAKAIEEFQCSAMTLEGYVLGKKIERVSALKMDIEGAELRALKGAFPILKRDRPVILLEVCAQTCAKFGYSADQLWSILEPLEYAAYRIGGTCGLSGWIDNFQNIEQANVLLIPRNRVGDFEINWDDKILRKHFLNYS
jgi:FkbM family methyltransferase